MELKSRPPVAGCQTIRRQYEQLTNELWLRQEDKVEAEREIQRLNEEYMIARDGAERQRIADLQGQAVADRDQALQRIDSLEDRLGYVNNDYVISGCEQLLGRLDQPSFNFR